MCVWNERKTEKLLHSHQCLCMHNAYSIDILHIHIHIQYTQTWGEYRAIKKKPEASCSLKSMSRPALISSNACFNHSPLLINAVWTRAPGPGGNLQALPFCCPCFQTGVLRGCAQRDSKSLPPFLAKWNLPVPLLAATGICFCLLVLHKQTKLASASPSQCSTLFYFNGVWKEQ